MVVSLPKVDSTNRYCEALDLVQVEDFTCYWALEQTAGIGQRGNHWASAPGENLTFSLVLKPDWLPAAEQFRLTEALSLGVVDCLNGPKDFKGFKAIVKWPNDVYVDGRKICGMLVSNRLAGERIAAAVCGIGINVNQREFPEWVPHPTSLALLTGETYAPGSLLERLLECIRRRYDELRSGKDLEAEYLENLMNLGQPARYSHAGRELTATITGIDSHGRLLLTVDNGEKIVCAMKEIEFILPNQNG